MTQYQVQYNIPRVMAQRAGKQNRLTDTVLRITPGMAEPIEVLFGNQDGVPLNLLGFKAKIIFWSGEGIDDNALRMGQSRIVLAKTFQISDPYRARMDILLSDEDTTALGLRRSINLRWGLFLINEQGDVFPMQITRRGGRVGNVQLDLASGMPTAELVRSA